MQLSEGNNKIKNFAAVLAIIQGVAWMILAIMCIVFYNQSKTIEVDSYMDLINFLIYKFYFTSSDTAFSDQTVTGGVFNAFAYIYLFVSLAWICLSLLVIRVPWSKFLTWWAELTILISVFDLILTALIGFDYSKCMDYVTSDNIIADPDNRFLTVALEGVCANGILPVMVIVSKGFVLLVLNFFFAIIVGRMGKQLKNASKNVV